MTTGKPDDIREQAKRIYLKRCDEVNRLAAEFEEEEVIDLLTRAILAAKVEEREAIAKFIFDAPAEVSHPAGPLYGAGYSAAVQMMCIAIRKHVDVNTAHKISGVE